jgi:3-dehydroquinate synthase
MESASRSITVDLGSRSYPVIIGDSLLQKAGTMIHGHGLTGSAAIVTDEIVDGLYGEPLFNSLTAAGFSVSRHVVASGEKSKTFSTAETVCEALTRAGIDRSGFIVALGGGVVGDLAGFVASIYARGIAYVQLPTTVMAQVDSAVGGKTAINLMAGKNLVGSFHQPILVLADTATLGTLPERVKNEGLAEVVKYGIIAQPDLIDVLSQPSLADFQSLVADCVSIKARIVSQDERESSGKRALLNFGHTIGHAIEAVAGYGAMLHGEAVSLGIRAALWLSVQKANFSKSDYQRVVTLLQTMDLPVILRDDVSTEMILEKVFADKKFVGGAIRFVLASTLGEAFVSEKIERDDLASAINVLRELDA